MINHELPYLSYQCDLEASRQDSPSDINLKSEILRQRSDGRIRPLVRLIVRIPRSSKDEPKVELGVFAEELQQVKNKKENRSVWYGTSTRTAHRVGRATLMVMVLTYRSDVLRALFPDLAQTVGKLAPVTITAIAWRSPSSSWTSTGWRSVRRPFRRSVRRAFTRPVVAALGRPAPRPRWPERTSGWSRSRSIFAPVRVFVVFMMFVMFVVSVVSMIQLCIGVFRFNVRVGAGGEALFRVSDQDDAVQIAGLFHRIGSSKGGGVGQAGESEEYEKGEQDHSFHRERWELLRPGCNRKDKAGGGR